MGVVSSILVPLAVAAAIASAGVPAAAWTVPVQISGPGEIEASIPRLARGTGGKMHMVYRHKEPGWDILYRERSAAGVWGPIEQVSAPWSERADIVEDPLGRPHVFYTGSLPGGKVDLYEAYKANGTWTVIQFTNTPTIDDDYPALAVDALGRMHLVYTKSTGSGGDIFHRVWTNGSWSGETYIGHNENTYYHRPDVSVDSANNVHVVWESSTSLYYRKFNGSSWLPQVTLATTPGFFSYPKVAAATPSSIAVVTFDQDAIKCVTSSNGGTTWTGLQYLNGGHYPRMDAANGCAHLVYEWAGGKSTGYQRWDGANWTQAQKCTPDTRWQGWADVAADASGTVHVVYDQDSTHVSYVNSAVDNIPPGQVTGFTATASDSAVQLSWTNPADPDYQATVIRCKAGSYPTSPTDGDPVCTRSTAPGAADTFTHPSLTNGATYYYSAFARDFVPNYSAPAHLAATPHKATCGETKRLPEGAFANLTGEVVTALFSGDGCIYVEEPDRGSGIRVVTTQTGLAVGDRVNITGTVGTRVVSGQPSERQISGATVTRIAAGTPLQPLAIGCASVGGAATQNVPGVRDGIGANNMGLLVRIAGRVTKVLGSYIFIDDGAGLPNVSGSGPEVGVMVRCSATPTFTVGSIVSATGIIEGSVPTGWPTNRGYIRARSASDVTVYRNGP